MHTHTYTRIMFEFVFFFSMKNIREFINRENQSFLSNNYRVVITGLIFII